MLQGENLAEADQVITLRDGRITDVDYRLTQELQEVMS
jgi:hypothetical protein